jgi:hypothetical protein
MSEEETSQGIELTQNLGTSPTKIARGEIDRRMFTNIDDEDIELLVFLRLGKELGNKAMEIMYDEFLHDKISVGGMGMRYAIRGESVRKGIGVNVGEEIKKPGWIERNITGRDWEKKERERLGIDESTQ